MSRCDVTPQLARQGARGDPRAEVFSGVPSVSRGDACVAPTGMRQGYQIYLSNHHRPAR